MGRPSGYSVCHRILPEPVITIQRFILTPGARVYIGKRSDQVSLIAVRNLSVRPDKCFQDFLRPVILFIMGTAVRQFAGIPLAETPQVMFLRKL